MEFIRGISPREYQERILQTCVGKNCLVVLPTGLGKTLIALMLAVERMKKFPGEKILFLAPTRPLAEQHLKYFKEHLSELFAEMELFTGSVPAEKRREIWQNADMIFSTPQCIANDLKNFLYDFGGVSLLVEDEAHRCLNNYSYASIAKKYLEQAKNPRILGLTASPGSEAAKISQICQNLSIEDVEIRTRESADVLGYLQEVEFEKVMIDFPEEFEEIRAALRKLFNGYVDELRMKNVLFGIPSKFELIKLQRRISNILANGSKNFTYYSCASACAQAIKLQHALELLETQTLQSFGKYLSGLLEQAEKKKSKGVQKLVGTPEFGFALGKTSELLAKGMEHPKIQKVSEIIGSEMQKNENAKIMIFTQFRDTASIISDAMNKIKNVKSKIFIGQAKKSGSSGETGLSQKEQKRIIAEFSSGEINIICATSIGEEGLDIPEVNAVIFYEAVPSAIRTIQRSGRTARLMKGKVIMLLAKKTRDENFYYVAKSREKKMHSAISGIKENFSRKSNAGQKQETMGKFF